MTTHQPTLATMIDHHDSPGVPEAALADAIASGHSAAGLLLTLTEAVGRSLAASGATTADVPTLILEPTHV